jgi:uncharacterized membrane-anchored protein YhcB (DUF1043 family)
MIAQLRDMLIEAQEHRRKLERFRLETERFERHVVERRAALDKELAALRANVEEQREQLDVMRQKAELLATTAADDFVSGDFVVGEADVEVALLRERQKRQRS